MAVSILGISPIEFWNSTPSEIYIALDSYDKLRKINYREQFETIRLQTFYIINSQRTEEEQIRWDDFMNIDKKEEELKAPNWDALDKGI